VQIRTKVPFTRCGPVVVPRLDEPRRFARAIAPLGSGHHLRLTAAVAETDEFARAKQGAQPPKKNTQASALRFFLTITLGRADLAHQLARTHYPLPRVLAREQVAG
jgi:hypothetical protein